MCRMNERTNELAGYVSKRNEYNCKNIVTEQTYLGLRHLWGSFFQTLNKDCCFVRFILRQMISRCWVCMFGSSHRPSRLGSYMKIYLNLTFPPKRVSGILRAERLCWTLKRKIFFLYFLYNELINIGKVERYRLFNSWKETSNGNKYYQASMIS